ncbi:MAG TPA: division/cell wall cluster transcriptional repressor MraZ [Patescibacteria group bacterium]
MLIGQFEGKVAEKHQIAFPKKFREILGDTLVITKGLEQNIIVVSEKNWKTLLEGTEGKPFTNKNARELQRYLLGNATYVELDSKGRFVLPEFLREYAQIETEVIYAGIERFVEIWDKKKWEEHQKQLAETIVSVAEKLSESPAQD